MLLCNSNKSHTNQNLNIQQPLITTICVNGYHQSRTGRQYINTSYILCNRYICLSNIDVNSWVLFCIKGCLLIKAITYPPLKLVTFPLPVSISVPRGSILGPLLFLLFLNDLPTIPQSCETSMYADDTECESASSPEDYKEL